MDRETLIEQITFIINQIEDCTILKDMLNLVSMVYRHYKEGRWGR